MEFTSKVAHKKLSGQTREVIANVIQFMQQEAHANQIIKPLAKVQERVALATGVSLRTVQKIAREIRMIEDGEKSCFTTPDTTRKRTPKAKLDD